MNWCARKDYLSNNINRPDRVIVSGPIRAPNICSIQYSSTSKGRFNPHKTGYLRAYYEYILLPKTHHKAILKSRWIQTY